jgi:hypothetical protein
LVVEIVVMVGGGVIHIDGNWLLSEVQYWIVSHNRHDDDHVPLLPDLDLLNTFKGVVNVLVVDRPNWPEGA